MGGIELQLLCGVRIELAVESLPYPGESGFPIVSPGRDRPLSGFPICRPCLDLRQNPSRDIHFPSYGRRPLPKPKPKSLWHLSKFLSNFFFKKFLPESLWKSSIIGWGNAHPAYPVTPPQGLTHIQGCPYVFALYPFFQILSKFFLL